jgi:hypothetical protein
MDKTDGRVHEADTSDKDEEGESYCDTCHEEDSTKLDDDDDDDYAIHVDLVDRVVRVLGITKNGFVFLDIDSWVCSIDLNFYMITATGSVWACSRHF